MKKFYVSCVVFFLIGVLVNTRPASAQGWIGNGGNTLYARNASLQLSPIYVGIGTSSPTAQLHTTGSVRFAGLTNSNQSRVLVCDASGNLYYRNVSTITGAGWSLTGNAAGSSNFIGTTNAQDFRIRTDNVQRMVVSHDGSVGINESTPHYKLSISGNTAGGGTYDGRTYINLVNHSTANTSAIAIRFQAGSDNSLYGAVSYTANTYTTLPNFSSTLHIFANGNGIQLSSVSDSGSIRFATGIDGQSHEIERMRITGNGNVGIGTTMPTARLNTNGTVRFQNLPSGSGTALVIDANGNVYRDNAFARTVADTGAIQTLRQQVAVLASEVEALKAIVSAMSDPGKQAGLSDAARLYQNAPNPFSASTTIRYYIPAKVMSAKCVIYDMQGRAQKTVPVTGRGKGDFLVGNLPAGMYVCTLYTDGRVADSKKMSSGR